MPLADLAAGVFSPFSAAGQQAIAGLQKGNVSLVQQLIAAEEALRRGNDTQLALARFASLGAVVLAVLLMVLVFLKVRSGSDERTAPVARTADYLASLGSAEGQLTAGAASAQFAPLPLTVESAEVTELDVAGAVVDRIAVDMSTIATSTAKMRTAIDSVGAAMQDMLGKLDGMVQDTAAGHDLVQNAANAAAYTADAVEELTGAASAMSCVVQRVTLLAEKTRQTAGQINADCEDAGRPDERFGAVVAGEVQSLVNQTATATIQIEETVAGILGNSRRYEEAIGQIVQNVSAINTVTAGLGARVLPPPAEDPAVELAANPAANPGPSEVPAEETDDGYGNGSSDGNGDGGEALGAAMDTEADAAGAEAMPAENGGSESGGKDGGSVLDEVLDSNLFAATDEQENELEQVVADTSALIDEVADLAQSASGRSDDQSEQTNEQDGDPIEEPAEERSDESVDEMIDELVAEKRDDDATADDAIDGAESDVAATQEGEAQADEAQADETQASEAQAGDAQADEAATAADQSAVSQSTDAEGDILILNKSTRKTTTAATGVASDESAAAIPEPVGSNRNVFILNLNREPSAPAAPEPASTEETEGDTPVMAPMDGDDDSLFILNKPRKT